MTDPGFPVVSTTQHPFLESVTLWTSANYAAASTDPNTTAVQFYFESRTFHVDTANEIGYHLQEGLRRAEVGQVPFVVIMVLTGKPKWLLDALSRAFPVGRPGWAPDWTREFLNPEVWHLMWERGTVMLPAIDMNRKRLSFVMQYPEVRADSRYNSQITEDTDARIKFHPVAAWVGSSAPPLGSGRSSVPIIPIACRENSVAEALQNHCVSRNWPFSQLQSCPARIFVDLFSLLADWSAVWRCAREELALRDADLHGGEKSSSVLQQTRALHRDTANVITLREELRLHLIAFQKFRALLGVEKLKTWVELFGDEDAAGELQDRIEECIHNLQHHQESAAVIHRQLENLLSLAFNTEMVSQGQGVARLNTLAFAFLPLSWVASLFGMTNFGISSVWYPLWAFVVIVLLSLPLYAHKVVAKYGIVGQHALERKGKKNDNNASPPLIEPNRNPAIKPNRRARFRVLFEPPKLKVVKARPPPPPPAVSPDQPSPELVPIVPRPPGMVALDLWAQRRQETGMGQVEFSSSSYSY